MALVAYNVLAVVKAALRSRHGENKIAHEVSGYYLYRSSRADLRRDDDRRARKALGYLSQDECGNISPYPVQLAKKVNLAKFKKHPRGPKKPLPKRSLDPKQPHVSTARLLKE